MLSDFFCGELLVHHVVCVINILCIALCIILISEVHIVELDMNGGVEAGWGEEKRGGGCE